MTKQFFMSAALVFATATSALAADFRASNRMTIAQSSGDMFTVSGNARLGARSYWCAAGEYALARLGLGKTDRLYVAVAREGRTGPTGFTASSAGLDPKRYITVSQTLKNPGGYVSVGQAEAFCRDIDELYLSR